MVLVGCREQGAEQEAHPSAHGDSADAMWEPEPRGSGSADPGSAGLARVRGSGTVRGPRDTSATPGGDPGLRAGVTLRAAGTERGQGRHCGALAPTQAVAGAGAGPGAGSAPPPRLSSAPANLRCSAGRFNAKPLCVSSTLLARSRSWSPAGQRGPRASSPGCAVPSQLYLLGCAAPCHALCAVPCCAIARSKRPEVLSCATF